jgi:hypothetical protein
MVSSFRMKCWIFNNDGLLLPIDTHEGGVQHILKLRDHTVSSSAEFILGRNTEQDETAKVRQLCPLKNEWDFRPVNFDVNREKQMMVDEENNHVLVTNPDPIVQTTILRDQILFSACTSTVSTGILLTDDCVLCWREQPMINIIFKVWDHDVYLSSWKMTCEWRL